MAPSSRRTGMTSAVYRRMNRTTDQREDDPNFPRHFPRRFRRASIAGPAWVRQYLPSRAASGRRASVPFDGRTCVASFGLKLCRYSQPRRYLLLTRGHARSDAPTGLCDEATAPLRPMTITERITIYAAASVLKFGCREGAADTGEILLRDHGSEGRCRGREDACCPRRMRVDAWFWATPIVHASVVEKKRRKSETALSEATPPRVP
ncbi:MAG: hypothetical protein QOK29_1558 [Rhodospirillaceae bacterium]|nr:hypothetical protein [Rhodospirillaceae bacterium]